MKKEQRINSSSRTKKHYYNQLRSKDAQQEIKEYKQQEDDAGIQK